MARIFKQVYICGGLDRGPTTLTRAISVSTGASAAGCCRRSCKVGLGKCWNCARAWRGRSRPRSPATTRARCPCRGAFTGSTVGLRQTGHRREVPIGRNSRGVVRGIMRAGTVMQCPGVCSCRPRRLEPSACSSSATACSRGSSHQRSGGYLYPAADRPAGAAGTGAIPDSNLPGEVGIEERHGNRYYRIRRPANINAPVQATLLFTVARSTVTAGDRQGSDAAELARYLAPMPGPGWPRYPAAHPGGNSRPAC